MSKWESILTENFAVKCGKRWHGLVKRERVAMNGRNARRFTTRNEQNNNNLLLHKQIFILYISFRKMDVRWSKTMTQHTHIHIHTWKPGREKHSE